MVRSRFQTGFFALLCFQAGCGDSTDNLSEPTVELFASSAKEACDRMNDTSWEAFELPDESQKVRIVYFQSSSKFPCGVTLDGNAVGIWTTDPNFVHLDNVAHCVEFDLPGGRPRTLIDAKSQKIHAPTEKSDELLLASFEDGCVQLKSAA